MNISTQRMRLFPLCPLMLVALLCLLFASQVTAQQAADAGSGKPSAADLMFTARHTDGLHKAAILNNGFYVQHDYSRPWMQAQSLEDLASASDLVILGTVQSERSELVRDGTGIETHYAIQVDRILKGAQPQGVADVVHHGGKVAFDDGTAAVVETPNQPVLLKGHCYALFLMNGEGHFRSVGEAQGTFEVDQNANWVHPHATLSFDPLRKYSKLTPDQFIAQVQTIVNRETR
jgi:hypothetical protein